MLNKKIQENFEKNWSRFPILPYASILGKRKEEAYWPCRSAYGANNHLPWHPVKFRD